MSNKNQEQPANDEKGYGALASLGIIGAVLTVAIAAILLLKYFIL